VDLKFQEISIDDQDDINIETLRNQMKKTRKRIKKRTRTKIRRRTRKSICAIILL